MENQKNDNLNMLEAIVQNTEMGKNTLDQLVPMAEDEQFKAELLRQRNIYRQLNQEAHAAIDACGGSAQGQSAMAKLNTKVSIGMKTITDKSTRNLAEMLTQGSGMGVVDCIKSQKDYPDAAPGSKRLMQRQTTRFFPRDVQVTRLYRLPHSAQIITLDSAYREYFPVAVVAVLVEFGSRLIRLASSSCVWLFQSRRSANRAPIIFFPPFFAISIGASYHFW